MAREFDSRGRPLYYDVDRTYSQAEFYELLRQLAASEDLARRDFSTLQSTAGYDPGGMGSWGSPDEFRDADGNLYRAFYVDPATGRAMSRESWIDYLTGGRSHDVPLPDWLQSDTPSYYVTALNQGGPGKNHNTFKLSEEFGVRPDQDWLLQAIYNPDGTLRDIVPRERVNESSWVEVRDALKPVAAMAALVAGGNWLANALQGAGAAGAAGLAEGTYAAGVVPSGAALGAGGAAAGAAGAAGAGLAEGTYGAAAGLGGATAGAAGAGAAGAAGGLGTAAGAAAGATTLGSLLSNPAVIGGGLSLVGGALGADAAGDAARAQEASANAAIEEIRRQYDQNRADQMPWLEAGQTSLADLMARMGDLTTPYTQADFQNDPGYQFELAEGQRALDAAARARGLYGSSGALRELLRYSQGLASTRYQDAWNRDLTNRQNTYNMLSGISGTGQVTAGNLGSMGQGAANTVGDLLTQTGNAQAAGRIGAANAWTNAGSQALNAWQQQMLLNRIGSNLYR